MGLYRQKHCQLELKGIEKIGQNKGKVLDFWESTGQNHIIQNIIQMCIYTLYPS